MNLLRQCSIFCAFGRTINRNFHRVVESLPPPVGQWVKSCSILTTTPNAVTSTVHDRMPVILDRADYDLWLDPGVANVEAVPEMLKPYDPRMMRCYPVSTRVNHVANDDEGCSTPVELAPVQDQLFSG